jgi:hypothetical protein
MTQKHTNLIQGSHTLFCISGESAEVEILAHEVWKELMQFGPYARKKFNLLRFVVSDCEDPAILEEATENFVVPVVVSYGIQDSWQLYPPDCLSETLFEQNLWRALDLEIESDLDPEQESE